MHVGHPVGLVVQPRPVPQEGLVSLPDLSIDRARRVTLELGSLLEVGGNSVSIAHTRIRILFTIDVRTHSSDGRRPGAVQVRNVDLNRDQPKLKILTIP